MPRSKATKASKKHLSSARAAELLAVLQARFAGHMSRHQGLRWSDVLARLEAHPAGLWSLGEMERTGGEPDVVGRDRQTDQFLFVDCSPQTPGARTSLCYDREALQSRKEHKPKDNAMDVASAMGIELLTVEQYRELQQLGEFDTKTSSWVETPADIRRLGGALFGDRRFGHVFIYHNGAESYYAARGFRGARKI